MSVKAPPWKKPSLALEASVVADDAPLEVVPKLYIGSIYAALNEDGLKKLGITHIVNASRFPPTFPNSFTYLTIDVRDHATANLLSCIPAANIFIEAGMDHGGVLVHCYGGRSRSAALIAAFLMSSTSTGFDDVLPMLYKARPITAINQGFERSLRAYCHSGYDVYRAQQVMLRARISALRWTRAANRERQPAGARDRDRGRECDAKFGSGSSNEAASFKGEGSSLLATHDDAKDEFGARGHKRERSNSSGTGDESSTWGRDSKGGSMDEDAGRAAASILRGMSQGDAADGKTGTSYSSMGGGCESAHARSSSGRRPSLGASGESKSASALEYPAPKAKMQNPLSLSNPPIRLSRPGSSTIRVIPPLRGLGREFSCRWTGCGFKLFSLVNILREDMLPSSADGWDWDSTAEDKDREANADDCKMEVDGGSDEGGGSMQADAKMCDVVPPSTTRACDSKSFNFDNAFADEGADRADNPCSTSSTNRNSSSTGAVIPPSTMRVANPATLHLGLSSALKDGAEEGAVMPGLSMDSDNKLSAYESPRIVVPPSYAHNTSSSAGRAAVPSLATGLIHGSNNAWSPGNSRPQSAERRRWMARMRLLKRDGSDAKVIQVAQQDDAVANSHEIGSSNYFHLEYLAWMGENLLGGEYDEGDICCPQCRHVIGSWSWTPHPRHTLNGRLGSPIIRVLKSCVIAAELGLDATPITTPRPDESIGSAHNTPRPGSQGTTPRGQDTPRGGVLRGAEVK